MIDTATAPVPAPAIVASGNSQETIYRIGDDGVLHLDFHWGQSAVWRSEARFVLMLAGKQGGKTSFGPWWLHREFMRRGKGEYLAVTTSFKLFDSKMLPEMRTVFEDILGIGRYWPGKKIMELADPTGRFWARNSGDRMYSLIRLQSIQAGLSSLSASTAKAAWLDEPGQDEWDVLHWEEMQARVALNLGRILGTSTIYNEGYVKADWYDHAKSGDPDYDVVSYESRINPMFSEEEYLRLKRVMPGYRFNMAYAGLFARPPSLIYGAFHESEYIDEAGEPRDGMLFDFKHADLPYWLPRTLMMDFGGANTAVLIMVEDTRVEPSIFYVYDEKMDGGRTSADYAKDTLVRLGSGYSRYPDNWSAVGGAKSEGQQRRDWTAGGLPISEPPFWDVEGGLENVIEFMKTDRLRVARHLSGLRHELATYKRKTLPDGTILNEIAEKRKFHRLDALRYGFSIHKSGVEDTAGTW